MTGGAFTSHVASEFYVTVKDVVAQTDTSIVPVKVLVGDFSISTIPFNDVDWIMEIEPSPGCSIGPD